MSICQKTDFLFLDEPTTYLEIHYQIELLELIKKLNVTMGLTIVMVLHDINQDMQYSDYVIVMKEEQIFREGNPEEVIDAVLLEEVYHIKAKVHNEAGMNYILTYATISN